MMREKIQDQNKEDEICEAFRVFDLVSRCLRLVPNLIAELVTQSVLFRTGTATSTGGSWG